MNKFLFKNSLIVIIGTAIANICNYLFTLYMGRKLGPANYGVLVSLFSLFYIFAIPSSTIQIVAAKFSSKFFSQKSFSKIHFLFTYLSKRIFILGVIGMIFLILLSPFISKILKLPSNVPLIIISLSLIFSFLVSINRGILQGIQKFKGFSVNNTIDPIAKLILGIILVWLGLSVNGAIIALVFAVFLAYILSFPFLKELFMQKQKKIKTKGLKIYTGSTLVSLLFLTLLVNQDILLVKHFFNAEEAGFYAGLATMGKIILFLSAPIIGVMFPVIANLYEKKEKHYHILISSFFLVLILSLIVLLVYFIAPNPSIKIFLGSSYLPIAPYLILFGFAILLYSLSNLLVSYFLSIDKKHFLWPLGASVILEFVLIWFYHQNFLNITKILILVMGLTFASFCFLYLYEKRRRILIKIKKEK